MQLRIGVTRAGRAMGFDTSSTQPLVLVGDPGCGKTTTARYLTRWWLADTAHHAHIHTPRPHEWADLVGGRDAGMLNEPPNPWCARGACLVVVDDPAPIDSDWDKQPSSGIIRSIRTRPSGHEWGRLMRSGAGPHCLGLVREGSSDPMGSLVLDGQGRLDWPADTVAVIPDRRGPVDFPCHRWWIPARGRRADVLSSDVPAPERSAARATDPSSALPAPAARASAVNVPVPMSAASPTSTVSAGSAPSAVAR